jgi:hypothetical protein
MPQKSWLDENAQVPQIDKYACELESFVAAMADGKIDAEELAQQEQRVVSLMREIEPQLADPLHERITQLLCELSAYSTMQTLSALYEARPKTQFRG